MENPNFLKEKYELQKAPEVEQAAKRIEKRTGQELPLKSAKDAEARIQNYLDRFKEIIERKDSDKRERGLDALKQVLHKKFVIKTKEIPEAYFDSIKRRHREEGHGNIEIPDDYRQELTETIINDQEKSLDNWIDYLASDDAKYPDWLKYYAIRSILRLGRYNKETKKFTERYGGTTSPFPELNREALAIVLDAFEGQAKNEPPKFGYDIQEDVKKQFLNALGQKNFAKLYALAIEEFKPIAEELLKITDGQWVKYPKGSNPKSLVKSISDYGTGWCLRGESVAKRYLVRDKNDLYVYYSFDETRAPIVPRVVIVVNDNNQIAEVRGVAEQENLDPYIGDVVKEKLQEFPDSKQYEKKSADMKQLTEIEKKTKQGILLNKDDLIFLYEINNHIEGFGYQRDPRIAEIQTGRTPETDMPIVFECVSEQIARTPGNINENTKAYVGKLEPGIFQKLPENLEHIYTVFPEKKIRREDIEIGGKSSEQLLAELEQAGINISSHAKDMLKSRDFTTIKNTEAVTLIRLTVADLGFTSRATTDQIYRRAQSIGLDLCPAEVGPRYRLKYQNQPMNEWVYVGMKQISASDGYPYVFDLDRYGDSLWLGGGWARPGGGWYLGGGFVFCLRKSES